MTLKCRIPQKQMAMDQRMTKEELTEHKSVVGSLHWLAGQTRPDLATPTSFSQHGNMTIADLKQLYSIIEYVRANVEVEILIAPIPLLDKDGNIQCVVLAYGDSAWANAEGLKSQRGFMVTLCSKLAFQKTVPCTLMDWTHQQSAFYSQHLLQKPQQWRSSN